MLFQECIERGPEMKNAEADRRRDSQRPRKFAPLLGYFCSGVGNVVQNSFDALVENVAVLRQRKLARRAMYECDAQALLEFRKPLARDRFRKLPSSGRLADRSGFCNGSEGQGGFRLQHCST